MTGGGFKVSADIGKRMVKIEIETDQGISLSADFKPENALIVARTIAGIAKQLDPSLEIQHTVFMQGG